ncbi:hypothetical protein [Vannielia sp.]|uniref:hypothetical protein n=1 Tax=Vannielia sp. TaxID=2813045 RepID=UPI002631D2BC|nr:hypothetical protein [Vannielia sp.]MDF1872883.1 hypothetical protein [Vannielia sp.]
MDDKTKAQDLKHMIDAAKRGGPEGSHPATKAALRHPLAPDAARAGQYARIERGHKA